MDRTDARQAGRLTWGLAAFARLMGRSDMPSPAPDHSASGRVTSGPVPITGQMSNASGKLHLVERRALRMRGNRRPEDVQAFIDRHKALLTCEATDAR